MSKKNIFIKSLGFSGYRSFSNFQTFDQFSKVNIFIGQNNCGKSNVLHFIHEIYPQACRKQPIKLRRLDTHIPTASHFRIGCGVKNVSDEEKINLIIETRASASAPKDETIKMIEKVFKAKREIDGTYLTWFNFSQDFTLDDNNWDKAFECLGDYQIQQLWTNLTGSTGGGRQQHWYPETLRLLTPAFPEIKTYLIPAIRRIGAKGSASEGFDGEGIIERLAKLQNPGALNQENRNKFHSINKFLQSVTANPKATIEIPYDRDTISVHLDGRTLPLESLGTGIHEVIILAVAATSIENSIICMEEPELHLNPVLQKKFIRYLQSETNNQYFITTHSASLMDTPDIEIYHIQLDDGQSRAMRTTSSHERDRVCKDLGYRPSDLLQSNCVIWVEGPSDRIYLNFWIRSHTPSLIEGIHYSIMFYGGKLAAHISADDVEDIIDDFVSLLRLNRRCCIVIDSDKSSARAKLNKTKTRLIHEFKNNGGHSWITSGREIENYIPPNLLKSAISSAHPHSQSSSKFGRFENTLSLTTQKRSSTASKVAIARHVTTNSSPDYSVLDLKKQISVLIKFINDSN